MKHLKTYELQSFSILKVGDYVLLKYSNDIFKIIEIDYKWSNPYFLEYYKTSLLVYYLTYSIQVICFKIFIKKNTYKSKSY